LKILGNILRIRKVLAMIRAMSMLNEEEKTSPYSYRIKRRVVAQYKGGVGYATRKSMWKCYSQWGPGSSQGVVDDDFDLTVNVGVNGRYCVRAGGDATTT